MASFCLAIVLRIDLSSPDALSLISSSDKMHRSMFSISRGITTSSSVIDRINGSSGKSLFIKETILLAMDKL